MQFYLFSFDWGIDLKNHLESLHTKAFVLKGRKKREEAAEPETVRILNASFFPASFLVVINSI